MFSTDLRLRIEYAANTREEGEIAIGKGTLAISKSTLRA